MGVLGMPAQGLAAGFRARRRHRGIAVGVCWGCEGGPVVVSRGDGRRDRGVRRRFAGESGGGMVAFPVAVRSARPAPPHFVSAGGIR